MSGDPEKLKRKLLDFAAGFPFFNHMGLEVLDMGDGWAEVRVTLSDVLRNPNGQMHGGVIATLIDMSTTQAMLMTETFQQVRDTKGILSTVDLRVKYIRALTGGSATVRAQVLHPGRRITHVEARVTNDEGKLVAVGDATMSIVLGKG